MWITFLIAECMVLAMIGHPGDGGALPGDAAEKREQKPHRRGRVETAVGQQTVVAEADSQAAGDPIEEQADRQPRPGEEKGRSERCQVDAADPDQDGPVEP